ncbi:MAG: DUF1761 domain-containing protein [Actinomycetota bacterium]
MSFETLGDLNWLAVLVAAVAYWVIGAVWYAPPVLGRAWAQAGGIAIPENQRPGPKTIVGPLLTSFVASVATAWLASATASDTVGEGLVLGLVVAVGYALTITALGALFEPKPDPGRWALINSGYHVIGLLVVGVIVSVWD